MIIKSHWQMPIIEHNIPTEYGWTVLYPENFILGQNTDLGRYVLINARYGVSIENDVQIGPYCAILSDNSINNKMGPVIIKRGARIGAYSLILPNTIIPANQFIKARSIIK